MEGQIPELRIKSGSINFPNGLKLEFIFGMVFNINGSYFFELHFNECLEIEKFYNENENIFLDTEYEIISTTIDGEDFKATQIITKSFPFHKSMADFYCLGSIEIKQRPIFPDEEYVTSDNLHFLIVEGLKVSYNSHSRNQDERFAKNCKYPFKRDGMFDFLSATFQLEDGSFYKFLIYNKNKEQVVIEFFSENQYQELPYTKWLEIKLDFIEFLSFLNGAKVIVREEHYGNSWSAKKLTGETSVYYSKERKLPKQYNNYMALQEVWFRSEQILQTAFKNNFHIYREKNRIWKLNTIIFYLNNAQETKSIGDRLFIQTILLERLSNTYAETFEQEWLSIIPEDSFNALNKDLIIALRKHKRNIESTKYNTLKSRINQLNKAKRGSNIVKFNNLIDGVGIQITENIEQLLIKRHKIIHEGDIGEFEEAIEDFELMDKLLRRIIVNIIGYTGATIEDGKQYQYPPEPLVKNKEAIN